MMIAMRGGRAGNDEDDRSTRFEDDAGARGRTDAPASVIR